MRLKGCHGCGNSPTVLCGFNAQGIPMVKIECFNLGCPIKIFSEAAAATKESAENMAAERWNRRPGPTVPAHLVDHEDFGLGVHSSKLLDELQKDPEFKKLNQEMGDVIKKTLCEVMKKREEIVRAFVAKYGWNPDECEQVIQMMPDGQRWFVRRKKTPSLEKAKELIFRRAVGFIDENYYPSGANQLRVLINEEIDAAMEGEQ